MNYQLPHKIQNCMGETLIFKELVKEPDGDRLLVENYVAPKSGPPMHTHYLQDESLTVVKGRIGYQVPGQEPVYAGEGETVTFKRGQPHRFWNAGDEVLHCTGWIKPANSIVFFLSAVYAAQNKSGSERPEAFDSAFLFTRYKSEFDMAEVPRFVKRAIIPVTYFIGKILGKYKHFEGAPAAVRRRQ